VAVIHVRPPPYGQARLRADGPASGQTGPPRDRQARLRSAYLAFFLPRFCDFLYDLYSSYRILPSQKLPF